ncbi:MAG: orotidine-5-phosphate decarboxylase [Tenuifilum sp.]|jgi:orotidine-5'-phosphate decarboxylase|uniref:orotidine-5'-phosphate decarboxylase n=1 Tax=Tenuifilum sp. TaxID=2760880 RepID=UPI0024AC2722|nr:orotidine-5'-phosphate decarboxylase [Tenuifilum sp.]MDI3527934.1 orotidine-5-phosphate decarboxylase [Tenuifilum sp.]
MTAQELFEQIKKKRSFLCVGLDTELTKIPEHLLSKEDPMFEFNKKIIEATHDLAIAYKLNLAFYEVHGASGWNSLMNTVKYIRKYHPEIFIIADAKRGDIANTARMYAKAYFRSLNCDAVTVSPYLGQDSVMPYLEYDNKWTILLAITSNESFKDFQTIENKDTGNKVFEEVVLKSMHWGSDANMMYVVGATHPEYFAAVRKHAPNHFLLVPGVGQQGGSLQKVAESGMTDNCGLIVNSSRGIIYADISGNFTVEARKRAFTLQQEMEILLKQKGLI